MNEFPFSGLTDEEVLAARQQYGVNKLTQKKNLTFLQNLLTLLKEPMVLLLLVAAAIYFVSGSVGDGIFMAVAIVIVATISLFQDAKSRTALEALKAYTRPASKVIRNGSIQAIPSEEIVMGDYLVVDEGATVTADGTIIQSNDFSVDESVITGESMPLAKDASSKEPFLYSGTIAATGLAIIQVTAIGDHTRLGQIGKAMESIKEEPTPLELQIANFVKKMVIIGVVIFIIVWVLNYLRSKELLDSLLKALTLAMSILPEEIPVAFTTFMALGAWRLMKMGIVVKQMKTVETLGSATVICTDKTGTLTENKMSLARVYALASGKIKDAKDPLDEEEKNLIETAMWASEPIPFDPMEVALHESYKKLGGVDERNNYKMYHEYPLAGLPPMMTHIFQNQQGRRIIAAKGAPETILKVSHPDAEVKQRVIAAANEMAVNGYRVLGVASGNFSGDNFPDSQEALPFTLKGIIAFYDPPKKNIGTVLQHFYDAGINVKIVTGDNAATTKAIAAEVGFHGYEKSIEGSELLQLTEQGLAEAVADKQIFTRMFPDAKMKIIDALKARHEIVAMTGDGVNDGPALKAAHIGIAMGKKGSEIAKSAAALILMEDDLSKMVDAVAMGRKIYTNLKKAIRYIISIHIPIILTVFLPLALSWVYPNIFSPVHVIFLELIMGPTCSIIYENEPMEQNAMMQPPRPFQDTFFNWKELAISVVQGLVITCGTLGVYRYAVYIGCDERQTRVLVFTCLITANIMLTLVNRSFYYSVWTTLRYKNNLVPFITIATALISILLIYLPPVASFFDFGKASMPQMLTAIGAGMLAVLWYEPVKWLKRRGLV